MTKAVGDDWLILNSVRKCVGRFNNKTCPVAWSAHVVGVDGQIQR